MPAYSRRDWGFTVSSTTLPTPSPALPYDTRPISNVQMLAIHIYVYGGLAFFVAVVVSALLWYAYIICYHRKMRDLPEELHFDDDFVLATRNLPRRPGFKVEPYEESSEWKRATESRQLRDQWKRAREEDAAAGRKNKQDLQLAAKSRNSQRISWASSVSTLKTNKRASAESDAQGLSKRKLHSGPSISSDPRLKSILVPGKPASFQFSDVEVAPVPQAHTELPRKQVHVEPNANIGQEMIATTGPSEAESWAGPRCTCNVAMDRIDALIQKAMCEVHRFN